ncbi:MAG: TIM barrel protein [Anaerohalosphaeraceae bacterium]
MAHISVCAECFFTGLPFEERVAKIADIGYRYIEFWHPEGTFNGKEVDFSQPKNAAKMTKVAAEKKIAYNDFAFGAWDGSIGGNVTNQSEHDRYFRQIQKMLDFAKSIHCSKGIILSGLAQANLTDQQMNQHIRAAFAQAVQMAEKAGITLLIEPLNTLVDHPGYFFNKTDEAVKLIREFKSPHLKLLYDVYHMQIMQGNILAFIEKNIDIIGHFHSAGVPGRAELFDTEINYPRIIKAIDGLGYKGCFGLEYFPRLDSQESLTRTLDYLS